MLMMVDYKYIFGQLR